MYIVLYTHVRYTLHIMDAIMCAPGAENKIYGGGPFFCCNFLAKIERKIERGGGTGSCYD